jgi:hypothetical protein
MQTLPTVPNQMTVHTSPDDQTLSFTFSLTPPDQQIDVVYLDRVHEVHVNLALGRLCTIGCRECSATKIGRMAPAALRGNLSPEAVGQKVRDIVTHLAPMRYGRSLVISTMNDGDPLTRPVDDLIKTVQQIQQVCADKGVLLDRINLSSSLVASKNEKLIELADRYQEAFGSQLVQIQASLLATSVKRNIFAGDISQLAVIAEALNYYREAMRSATGRGEVWVNYVAVKQGDFGRADGADQLESIARVADTLLRAGPQVKLKITRGTVDDLDGWQQLDDDAYEHFIDAVLERWGAQLAIYCPDRRAWPSVQHRCGRIQG